MKSYTDIEQSRKLAEILPLKSADMDYIPVVNIDGEYSINVNIWNNDHIIEEGWLPCWSLTALLEVLPKIIKHETLFIETSAVLWHIGYRNIYIARADNLVDACYEMILKLHELNLL